MIFITAFSRFSFVSSDFQSLDFITARKARHGRKRASGRKGRMRLNAVFFEPEIGPTHNRGHVSRNKFSGYRVYFRCAGRRPVPGCTAIGDVFGCRCNIATGIHAVSGFGARKKRFSVGRNDGQPVTLVTAVRSIIGSHIQQERAYSDHQASACNAIR